MRRARRSEKAKKTPLYGVDSMTFIYHFEENPEFGDAASALLRAAEDGRVELVTSVITLLEILVVPKRDKADVLVEQYREALRSFPNLRVIAVDEQIVEIASDLRAAYGIKTPDAIQLATAMREQADAFVTEDRRLRLKKAFKMIPLERAVH